MLDPKLSKLFDDLNASSDPKARSIILAEAKCYIFNTMTKDMLKESFVCDEQNFEALLALKQSQEENAREPFEIVELIFHSFNSLIELIDEFGSKILLLFKQDKDEELKQLCSKNLLRLATRLETNDFEAHSDPCAKLQDLETKLKRILPTLVRQIPANSVRFSQLLGQLFCCITKRLNVIEAKLIEKHHNITAVFSSTVFDDNAELIDEFKKIAKLDSTNRIRVLEIFLQMAVLSRDHLLNICGESFDLNEHLKDLLSSKDFLIRLNIIELLSDLAITLHGYEYLDQHGHLRRLLNEILKPVEQKDMFSEFTDTAVIKLFSYITKVMPEKVEATYPEYFDILFEHIFYEDIIEHKMHINLALQTFLYLFESSLVKIFFYEKYKHTFSKLLQHLVTILKQSIDDETKSTCLSCIAHIIAPDPALLYAEHSSEKYLNSPWIPCMSKESEDFYNLIVSQCTHQVFFNLCLDLAKRPFMGTRMAAQVVFKALAQTKWGLAVLFSENKKNEFLTDYLLNRSIEIENEGLESKFQLIQIICANFKANYELLPIIGEYNLESLEEYIRLGIYYSPVPLKVTTENV